MLIMPTVDKDPSYIL